MGLVTRKRLRLARYDYRDAGWYFVTICTFERQHTLGQVVEGRVVLSSLGSLVDACWKQLGAHHPHAIPDSHVIMPNHVHGLIHVPEGVATPTLASAVAPGALGAIVRSFKSGVTRRFRELAPSPATGPVWQANYYEHVVRSLAAVERIREYIRTNPERWELDPENPARTGRDTFDAWLLEEGKRPDTGASLR